MEPKLKSIKNAIAIEIHVLSIERTYISMFAYLKNSLNYYPQYVKKLQHQRCEYNQMHF